LHTCHNYPTHGHSDLQVYLFPLWVDPKMTTVFWPPLFFFLNPTPQALLSCFQVNFHNCLPSPPKGRAPPRIGTYPSPFFPQVFILIRPYRRFSPLIKVLCLVHAPPFLFWERPLFKIFFVRAFFLIFSAESPSAVPSLSFSNRGSPPICHGTLHGNLPFFPR